MTGETDQATQDTLERIASGLDPDALASCRWFREKAADPAGITIESAGGWLVPGPGAPVGAWLMARVGTKDTHTLYQIPLRFGDPDAVDALGRADVAGRRVSLLDGAGYSELLTHFLSGSADVHVARYGSGPPDVRTARDLRTDSSNTLCLVNDTVMVKLYRAIDTASRREAWLLSALAERGSHAVPEVLGVVHMGGSEGPALALVQTWVPGAQDAWTRFTTALASGPNRSLIDEAHSMGEAVGRVHADLFALGHRPWTNRDTEAAQRRVAAQAGRLAVLGLPEDAQDDVNRAVELCRGLRADPCAVLCHVHGDLHLGQIILRGTEPLLLDFEGEPMASPEEREAVHAPQKDVAGMLRSFAYAAGFASKNGAPGRPEDWAAWISDAEEAFLGAYSRSVPFPPGPELLTFYCIEKALYETAYEAAFRPDWADIPLAGLRSLTRVGTRSSR